MNHVNTTTPATQNTEWGFWGTMTKIEGQNAPAQWQKAFDFIRACKAKVAGVAVTDDEIRYFLDSKGGRHLADAIADCGSIEAVHAKWPVHGYGFWFFQMVYAARAQAA